MNDLKPPIVSKTLRILYPIWMIIGMFGLLYVPSQIFVHNNPTETAQNIMDNELLFRLGVAARLVTQLLGIVIPLLLFLLFKSYNRPAAIAMLLFSLIGVPISMYGESHSLMALSFFDSPELMMQHLDIKWIALNIASIFWGLWLLPLGFLTNDSGLFPKLIGYSLIVAGLGYLVGAFLKVVAPDAEIIYSITEIMTIGEVIFILWFVIKGTKPTATSSEVSSV